MRTPALVAENLMNSGLGNRLRFTLSAQCVAEAEGRAFYWTWPTKKGIFEPRFNDLWHYDAGVELTRKEAAQHRNQEPPFDKDIDLYAPGMAEVDAWHIRASIPLATRTGTAPWDSALRALKPVESINAQLESFRAATGIGSRPYVGVMVRANEKTHAKTLEASPVEWYMGRMRAMLERDPDAEFFLSCDSPDVQERIQADVPNVHALTDKGEYNSTEGVRSSIVDLYLLAESVHILAPYWSSFGTLAWLLSGKVQPLENSRRLIRPHSAT